jgi:hypothetical protein
LKGGDIMKHISNTRLAVAIPAVAVLAIATWAGAAPLHRVVSDFQDTTTLGQPEVFSTALPAAGGAGGSHVYTKSVSIPPNHAVYITFTATGDTHQNAQGLGAALLMSASVTNPAGVKTVCEAPITGGLPDAGPTGWISLQKLPSGTGANNCNDGGGGDSDCHDNNLVFSCCVLPAAGGAGNTHTVDLRLASENGAIVFYERANVQVDITPNPGDKLCTGQPLPADYSPAG